MSILPVWFLRIDDRLVHGQVCVGWCDALEINRIVLADDEIVVSDFERDLYACCPAADQLLSFSSLADLATAMAAPPPESTLIVLAGTAEALRLVELGAPVEEILVGGLHDQPGAREVADYLFLTPGQESDMHLLLRRGIRLVGQPLPGSPRLDIAKVLQQAGSAEGQGSRPSSIK